MRRLAVFAAASLAVSFVLVAAPARAQDDEKAVTDYKAIETWLEGQKPKNADERKALRVEMTKRLKAFLKDYPSAGKTTLAAKNVLADVVAQDGKLDEALAIYEEFVKGSDEEFQQRGRWGVVKTLVAKKDVKGARARLDGFMKEHQDDKNLQELDGYLKQLETGKSVKVGAPAPSFKTDSVELAALKGKIVLLDFWATWCPPCKKDLPQLRKLYADLKGKGFEIVGVDAFEKDWAAYKAFVAKEQVSWPQVTEKDAKAVARDYGVEHLPRTVLVGKDGKVLALDLRADALVEAIKAAVEDKPLPKAKGPAGLPKAAGAGDE